MPSSEPKLAIGERIKQARRANKLSQAELASLLGCHPHSVAMWETGRRGVSLELLQRFSQVLGRPVSWFLSETPDISDERLMPVVRQTAQLMVRELVERYDALQSVKLRVVGAIPGRGPIAPQELAPDVIELPKGLVGDMARAYAFRVSGPELEHLGIHQGDTVIVDPSAPVVEGKIYVVRIGLNITAQRMSKTAWAPSEVLGRIILHGHWSPI